MKIFATLFTAALLASCNPQPKTERDGNNTKPVDSIPTATSADTGKRQPSPRIKTEAVYKIILKTNSVPGKIDTAVTAGLPEPIRALSAFYAAMGGTLCDGKNCKLTTALGLGKQGSDQHKQLIKKYFPNDDVAETVISQDCYLRPSGASSFSDFEYLTISDYGDSVRVDYSLMYFNRGTKGWVKGPDTYLFRESTFKKVRRNIW